MNTKLIVAAALIVALGAGAVVVGGDLLSGGTSDDTEPFPTATETPASGDDGGSDGAATTAASTSTPPFAFTIDNIEECGQTCRDVTSTLTNQQDTTAEDVTVYTRIFAGQGTDGDEVWRGSADVGTLDAGESHTETRRVELSLSDGLAIENEDGWITIQTTVETADQTITFTEQRQVA